MKKERSEKASYRRRNDPSSPPLQTPAAAAATTACLLLRGVIRSCLPLYTSTTRPDAQGRKGGNGRGLRLRHHDSFIDALRRKENKAEHTLQVRTLPTPLTPLPFGVRVCEIYRQVSVEGANYYGQGDRFGVRVTLDKTGLFPSYLHMLSFHGTHLQTTAVHDRFPDCFYLDIIHI